MKASLLSVAVFLLFAGAGLGLAALLQPPWLGAAAFLAMGLIGSLASARIFNRLATPEEKRRELEDRVRNSDL
jgi:uncharacterized membrane protein YfcA